MSANIVKVTELATMKCTVSNWLSLKLLMATEWNISSSIEKQPRNEIIVKCLGGNHQFRECQQ